MNMCTRAHALYFDNKYNIISGHKHNVAVI